MRKIIVPGPKTAELIREHKKYLATTTHDEKNLPISVDEARGIYIWDEDGNKFIDCTSQVSIADIGHNHPKVITALVGYLRSRKVKACIGTDFYNRAQVEAAKKIVEDITKKSFPDRDWRVYFCSSGAESNVAAAKLLTDLRPRRRLFFAFLGAFHGRLGPALAFSSSKSLHKRGFSEDPPTIHLPYPDCNHCAYEKSYGCDQLCIRIIEKEYLGRLCDPGEINGVIIEPIQGEGGFILPDNLAMKRLADLCKKYDWALISDEVQAGLGRTGKMFAIEHYGIVPDIITVAKKLGSGFPIGATIFRADWDFTEPGRHSTTFGGEPLGWVAAKRTLEVIEEENLVENAAQIGAYFLDKMMGVKERFNHRQWDIATPNCRHIKARKPAGYISDVRGLGLMIGVEFTDADGKPNPTFKNTVLRECIKYGIIPISAGHPDRNPTLRFSPPLILTKDDADKILSKFEKALNATIKRLK